MLYSGGDQDKRMGDSARAARDDQRRFARRIDCDAAPRQARVAPARGGSARDRDGWERSRRGYGG